MPEHDQSEIRVIAMREPVIAAAIILAPFIGAIVAILAMTP
jgi:hypothetical protein